MNNKLEIDYSKVTDIELGGLDYSDAPDFCDAYIVSATIEGRDATDEELDLLNDESNYIYELVQKRLY